MQYDVLDEAAIKKLRVEHDKNVINNIRIALEKESTHEMVYELIDQCFNLKSQRVAIQLVEKC